MKPVAFLQEVRKELRKVSWPARNEVVKMTTLVIVISLAVGIYIGTIDITLTKVMGMIVQ